MVGLSEWGSQRDRDALDRHITGNYGEDQFVDTDEQEIESGMLQWEPGTLSTTTLNRVLTDALADLWQDCYRQTNEPFRKNLFRQQVAEAIRCATGETMQVR